MAAGRVDEQTLDDLAIEFTALNEEFIGTEHRYQYAVSFPDQDGRGRPLLVLDASGLDRIAAVHLPRQVADGIHGSWIPDSALDGSDR
ncbi:MULTISPECIES: carotenoid oxygenase family protein [unclassified Streptomyces]|uniref:carotenoid oxygenase family protein n=1 Tax=unclassified Streptomyces TaxID=2593676 RepID=UPI001EF8F340|nr:MULTISPECIES: carotenoid oxygenase family protein [unclassified Streptomyces]